MVDYREILRLLSLGYNLTQISESLHSSRNSIRDVKERAEKIELHLSEDVTNQMLYELLYPETGLWLMYMHTSTMMEFQDFLFQTTCNVKLSITCCP